MHTYIKFAKNVTILTFLCTRYLRGIALKGDGYYNYTTIETYGDEMDFVQFYIFGQTISHHFLHDKRFQYATYLEYDFGNTWTNFI